MPDNALRTIEVRLSITGNVLMVDANLPKGNIVGSQYDHNAQRLLIARPQGFDALNLWLHFRDDLGREASVDIEQDNEYLLPNSLTQTMGLRLQVAFQEGDVFRESANVLLMKFHPAIRGGSTPSALPHDPSSPQGGTGAGTSATFQIVQTNTGAPGSNATTTEAYNSTPSDRRYILTIPRGMDGSPGAPGAPGTPGATGAPGSPGIPGTPGERGPAGADGRDGTDGKNGSDGIDGIDGTNGADGTNGIDGTDGTNGTNGIDGKSAYQTAIEGGYTGTEAAFYAALVMMPLAITSPDILRNVVLTAAEYDELVLVGAVDPLTAYDIVEDTP